MTRLAACSALLLLILSSTVLAETPATPTPWPPDPATIFAESVPWSLYEEPVENTPIRIDEEQQVIHVAETGREYPFPERYSSLYDAVQQPDGLIRVFLSDKYDRLGNILLLDLETGLYEEPETACHDEVIRDEAGHGRWTVLQRDKKEYDEPYLCNTETGEERDAFSRISPQAIHYFWGAHETPDPDRLVLSGYTLADYQIFVYNLATDQFIKLGVIGRGIDDDVYLCDWLTDTQGIYCSKGTHNGEGESYYSFDIDKADSMERIFSGWNTDTFRLENPTRYISVSDYNYDGRMAGGYGEPHSCTLLVYDANGQREHKLGDQCLPIAYSTIFKWISPYFQQGNMLYFLTTDNEDATTTFLKQYDTAEDTVWPLGYPTEMESILGVSPDEHYMAVLLDDNGVLDFPWDYCCNNDTRGRRVAIINLENGDIPYQSEPMGVYVPDQVMWADNTTLIISADQAYQHTRTADGTSTSIQPSSLHRIHLDDKGVTVSSTTAYASVGVSLSPDGLHGFTSSNQIIDLKTFEPIQLLRDDLDESYTIGREWQEDGRLKVEISIKDDYYTPSISYLVTFPNSTSGR